MTTCPGDLLPTLVGVVIGLVWAPILTDIGAWLRRRVRP